MFKKIHGHATVGHMSPTYISWIAMRQRCTNPKHIAFDRYGGKGINFYERWNKFENFLEDMGIRPKGMTMDRIDNNKGYYKENCRWATPKEQRRNRNKKIIYLTYNNKTLPVLDWSKETGILPQTIIMRKIRGWKTNEILGFKNRKMNSKITEKDLIKGLERNEQIKKLRKNGFILKSIGNYFGISISRVRDIL